MLNTDFLVGDRIADTLHDDIKVVACQVTMKAQNLTDNDMLPHIGYVPSVAVELIKKQQQGYTYIRP
jgi:intracellular sulfur oxidation DsrE/DsrF family protein